MPDSLDIDLSNIREKTKIISDSFGAELLDKDEIELVAFGLKALKLIFMLDESKGSEKGYGKEAYSSVCTMDKPCKSCK